MKNLLPLLLLLLSVATGVSAQNIKNGKLISWPDAKGSIVIPNGVTEIAENCFYTPGEDDPDGWGASDPISNLDITSVDLNMVTHVGKNAFKGCINIKSTIANQLKSIDSEAFSDCSGLEEINLPNVENIGERAFANCEKLTTVYLGEKLHSLVGNPFQNCTQLASLSVSSKNSSFVTVQNALIEKQAGVLRSIAGAITKLELTNNCKSVGVNAFFGCPLLEEVNLPYVQHVAQNFINCPKLRIITLPRAEIFEASYLSFNGASNIAIVDVHLASTIQGLESILPNRSNITIYVATAQIKAQLETKLTRCKIIVGEPSKPSETVTVNFSANEGGKMEAWTTGGVNIESGTKLTKGSMVAFKAIPLYKHRIKNWVVNGKEVTEGISNEGTNGQVYRIDHLQTNTEVKVTFEQEADGYTIFFKSKDEAMGQLTCQIIGGKAIKSGDIVPTNAQLLFTATPKVGYRITDWLKDVGNGAITFKPIEGQNGKSTYQCKAEDGLDIRVDFDRIAGNYIVKFSSLNTKAGELTAKVDNKTITSGESIPAGKKVLFTAHPKQGYVVDEWLLNNETLVGIKTLTYTIESLNSDVEVNVVCSEKKEPIPNDAVIENGVLKKWTPEGEAIIPNSVTSIAPRAFEGANNLTKLTLNSLVNTIGELPFLYCTKLTEIVVPADNKSFSSVDGVLYNKSQTELIAYPSGSKKPQYTLLATTNTIKPGAFTAAPFLQKVNVPEGNNSFKVKNNQLYNGNGTTLLFLPITGDKNLLNEVTIPEGVTTIGRLAICFNPTLKKLILPSSLKTLAPLSVMYNSALEEFVWEKETIPSLCSVADSAFYYCRNLKTIPYMPQCKSFGKASFGVNSMLSKVTIAAGCNITNNTFWGCEAIREVKVYSATPQVITNDTFASIVSPEKATLIVPKGSEVQYKNAIGWNIFGHIVTFDPLNTNPLNIKGIIVSVNCNNEVSISNVPANSTIRVYAVNGDLLFTTTSNEKGEATFRVGAIKHGIILIKVDNDVTKVVI